MKLVTFKYQKFLFFFKTDDDKDHHETFTGIDEEQATENFRCFYPTEKIDKITWLGYSKF